MQALKIVIISLIFTLSAMGTMAQNDTSSHQRHNAKFTVMALVDSLNPIDPNLAPELIKTDPSDLLILTINLHAYQEENQTEKLQKLVDFIGELDIDFVALQECAQHKDANLVEGEIKADNMALIITELLRSQYRADYNFVWTWPHYGWNVWEEGVAILSKHPLVSTENQYISGDTLTTQITSRKAIIGTYKVSDRLINMASVHSHWRTSETDESQNNQMRNIHQLVDKQERLYPNSVSFVGGDYNLDATSDAPWNEGYFTFIDDGLYTDSYLAIHPGAIIDSTKADHFTVDGDYPGRIDYIFMKRNQSYQTEAAQIVFTDKVLGKISDHAGVLTKFTFTQN